MNIKFSIVWYDAWIGVYIPPGERKIYVCLLPCCVIRIALKGAKK